MLSNVLIYKDFEPGEIILKQNEPIQSLYIIKQGTCQCSVNILMENKTSKQMEKKRILLGDLKEMDLVGEEAIISHFKGFLAHDYETVPSIMHIKAITKVTVGSIVLSQCVNLFPRDLKLSSYLQRAIDPRQLYEKYQQDFEYKKWKREKQRILDSLLKERFHDPRMTYKKWMEPTVVPKPFIVQKIPKMPLIIQKIPTIPHMVDTISKIPVIVQKNASKPIQPLPALKKTL
jgi:hypothetical protein